MNSVSKDFNSCLNILVLSKHCEFNKYNQNAAHLKQVNINVLPKVREKLLMKKGLTLSRALDVGKCAVEGSKWAEQLAEASTIKVKKEVNVKLIVFN